MLVKWKKERESVLRETGGGLVSEHINPTRPPAESWGAGTQWAAPLSFLPTPGVGQIGPALPRPWENTGWPPRGPSLSPEPVNPCTSISACF